MSRIARAIAALVFTATLVHMSPAYGDQAAAAPSAAPAAQAMECPAHVFTVVPLQSGNTSSTYAISFETAGPAAGRLSGVVALYSGNDRYDVHVQSVVAAGSAAGTLSSATPAVVHFPKPVTIDAAYLVSLDGDDGGPCEASFAWLKQPPSRSSVLKTVIDSFDNELRQKAAHVAAVDAPQAARQAAPACKDPNQPPRLTRRAQSQMVGGDQLATGAVITEVALSETGSVVDAWIWGWAGPPGTTSILGDFAIQEAKQSGYAPATFRCQAIASLYLGVISFTAGGQELPHV
jgi:hypothetical protein